MQTHRLYCLCVFLFIKYTILLPCLYRNFFIKKEVPIKVRYDFVCIWQLASLRINASRSLYKTLKEKEYPNTYSEFRGGHDEMWWRKNLSWGLLVLNNSKTLS